MVPREIKESPGEATPEEVAEEEEEEAVSEEEAEGETELVQAKTVNSLSDELIKNKVFW